MMGIGMKVPITTTAVACLIVLALAAYEYFSGKEYRIGPVTLLLIAALLAARYATQLQARKRADILKAVPKRPLGLDE